MFSQHFSKLSAAIHGCSYSTNQALVSEDLAMQTTVRMLQETKAKAGVVYVIGNGGSAGIASHFSNDLMKALKIPSQTFYDSNLLTCLSNDLGYEEVFKYPLEMMLKPADLLIAISSSGKSPNILKAAELALEKGVNLITFSGFNQDNPLKKLGQLNFWIDRCHYGLVEMAHFFLLHTIIDLWNQYSVTDNCHAKITRDADAKNQILTGTQ